MRHLAREEFINCILDYVVGAGYVHMYATQVLPKSVAVLDFSSTPILVTQLGIWFRPLETPSLDAMPANMGTEMSVQ